MPRRRPDLVGSRRSGATLAAVRVRCDRCHRLVGACEPVVDASARRAGRAWRLRGYWFNAEDLGPPAPPLGEVSAERLKASRSVLRERPGSLDLELWSLPFIELPCHRCGATSLAKFELADALARFETFHQTQTVTAVVHQELPATE